MKIYTNNETSEFINIINEITKNSLSWSIVEISILDEETEDIEAIANQIRFHFYDNDSECHIFIQNEKEIILLANKRLEQTYEDLEKDIVYCLENTQCSVVVSEASNKMLEATTTKIRSIEKAILKREKLKRERNLIMIAEDDMYTRSLAKEALQDFGEIIELSDGESVINEYKDKKPDILFLDIHLPNANGLKILSEIAKYDENAYVVILTSDEDRRNIAYTKKYKVKDFIIKPFTTTMLLESIKGYSQKEIINS